MDIKELEKTFMETKNESEAQFKVILDLQGKLTKANEEISHLKHLLEQSNQVLSFNSDPIPGVTNEQLICEIQIKLLKDRAIVKELSKEEAQKLQIYVTILEQTKKNKDTNRSQIDNISSEDLIKLVENI